MARQPRKLIGNIFLHNMVQGLNKEYIFENIDEKNKYKNLIKKYSEKYKILIIAYCIMDNHAHLLTYSQNIENLSLFMKECNTEYATYYNKRKNRVGYVFKNRFISKSIYDKKHLYTCIKYIHMNPVKAKICKQEKDYEFSSYNEYLNQEGFINSNVLEIIFNSNENYLEKFKSIKYTPMNFEKEDINIKEILQKFVEKEEVTIEEIKKNNTLIKKFIAHLIQNEYKFTKNEIAEILGISRSSLYRRMKNK